MTLSRVLAGDDARESRDVSPGAGSRHKERARRLPRAHPAVIVVAGSCAALFHQALHTGLAGDVFYQLAAGRWMLAHHAVARADVFSYTVPGRHWLDEEWGFQVLLAWSVAHLGPVSYWLLSAGACSGAVLAMAALARRCGAGWLWTAALSVLAAAGLSVGLADRPQDLSYLLFALLLYVLVLARGQPRWLWAVPPLLAVWANVHGSFLLGLAVLALELLWAVAPAPAGWLWRRQGLPVGPLALTLLAALGATMLNPRGPALLGYALRVSTSPQLGSLIAEWQSPDFHSYLLLVVVTGPVLALLGLLVFSGLHLELGDLFLMVLLWLATLHAVRFTPYMALAACVVLVGWVPLRHETLKPGRAAMPLAVVLCAALVAGPHVPAGAPQAGTGPLATPVAATGFLARQSGRVFSTYWWDDYLVSRGIPVFVDGRTDLYFGTGLLQAYVDVSDLAVSPGPVLARWDVEWVMWDEGAALSTYLRHDPHWRVRFEGGGAVVFQRARPGMAGG